MARAASGAKAKGSGSAYRVIADNRKARYNYELHETFEAGLELTGTEVKSLRESKASLAESYIAPEGDELFLINAHIPEYAAASRENHAPRRPRRLLMHRREINSLSGSVQREGYTIVPLKLYFNERGRAKLQLALAKGKKLHDKRETEKQRSWNREKARLMREKG